MPPVLGVGWTLVPVSAPRAFGPKSCTGRITSSSGSLVTSISDCVTSTFGGAWVALFVWAVCVSAGFDGTVGTVVGRGARIGACEVAGCVGTRTTGTGGALVL